MLRKTGKVAVLAAVIALGALPVQAATFDTSAQAQPQAQTQTQQGMATMPMNQTIQGHVYSPQYLQAMANALGALHRVHDAVQLGVNLDEYRHNVIEMSAAVDTFLYGYNHYDLNLVKTVKDAEDRYRDGVYAWVSQGGGAGKADQVITFQDKNLNARLKADWDRATVDLQTLDTMAPKGE